MSNRSTNQIANPCRPRQVNAQNQRTKILENSSASTALRDSKAGKTGELVI
jgi:hypothetical protein